MEISRILVPVDFSEFSEHAVSYAVAFAKGLGATVELVHVYPLRVYAAPPMLPAPVQIGDFRKQAEKAFDELAARLSQSTGTELTGRVVEGIPHEEINRVCKDRAIDLIIMGTHGRTGIEHTLIGSVAERVVRTAPVPVLTVPKR